LGFLRRPEVDGTVLSTIDC
jgi:hypothetical protein